MWITSSENRMKNSIIYFLLLYNFFFVDANDYKNFRNSHIINNNIKLISISYELSYDFNSIIKIILKVYHPFYPNRNFNAFIKSEDEIKVYTLSCSSTFLDIIECLSQKNLTFDVTKKYYFYYNRSSGNSYITFNGKDIYKDNKAVSLIFRPKILDNITIYNDDKSFDVIIGKDIVSSGYLYLARKTKKVLQKPKNGFNKYIELNNFIPHCGLAGYMPQSTLVAYKEAIRRGYKIVDGDILFTKDKIPVICHGKELENISNGKGDLTEKTLEELEKLDFGIKFSKKYAGEKILKFEELLKLCKENNIILDLDLWHLKSKKYFNSSEYIKIILKYLDKYDMINSIYFNDERKSVVELFFSIRPNISFSINGMNEKKSIEKIKNKYKSSKILIYNMGFLSSGRTINEESVKYGLNLGKKIKAAKIDDLKFAEKVASWGVNFICTNKLHPFLIPNEKEEPIPVKCSPLDLNNGISKCKIGENIKLIDNEIYNIYYSTNIYNISEDIVEVPIGEFKYIDTYINNKSYYSIEHLNYKDGIIRLRISNILKMNEKISGEIGPAYDNVADCYIYNFTCSGKNSQKIDCIINKNDPDKVEFNGKYKIYRLHGYSFRPTESYNKLNSINSKKKEIAKFNIIFVALFMITLIFKISICVKKSKNKDILKIVKIIADN